MKNSVKIIPNSEGKSISIAGNSYRVIVSGAETNGNYAVIDMLVPPGGGPGPHAHNNMQEMFYVVDGEVEFSTENGKQIAGKGSLVNIPLNGGAHGFKNKSDKMAHLLCTVIPAGLDDFFLEIGKPVNHGEFLPAEPMTPEKMEKLKEIGARYGQEFFSPDFLDR